MTNEAVTKYLSENEGVINESHEMDTTEKLFIFSIDDKSYAVLPAEIREIYLTQDIYPMPLCPAYVSGLINLHGNPCTVLDIKVLIDNEKQSPSMFLILNLPDDMVGLAVSEIVEISDISTKSITNFSSEDEHNDLFIGSFVYNNNTVLWIKPSRILEKLAHDI